MIIPLPDLVIISVLLAPSSALVAIAFATHANGSLGLSQLIVTLFLVFPFLSFAIYLAFVSMRPARWLSKFHLDSHGTAVAQKLSSLRHHKSTGKSLPCPYPDGWYGLVFSEDLRPGAMIDSVCCGKDLIVMRPREGPASVLDAYCSHQGAHLAHGGGCVDSDSCIVCPFHGWRFDRDGKAVSCPSGDAIPSGSDLKKYPVMERNGVICVWMSASSHGAKGQERQPWFEPPIVKEVDLGLWRYDGFCENIVNAVTQELQENGPDLAHLHHLHSSFAVTSLQWLLSHSWEMSWDPGHGDESHLAFMKVFQWFIILKRWTLPLKIEANLIQVASSLVIFKFNLPLIGRVVLIQTVTPQAPARQRMCHGVFSEPHVPRFVAKILLYIVQHAVEQDVPIWEHKRFEPAPRLTAMDGKVKLYRQWCKQFTRDGISFNEAQIKHVKKELGLPDEGLISW